MVTKWQKWNLECFFMLLADKELLSYHSKHHHTTTTEILRWLQFDRQLISADELLSLPYSLTLPMSDRMEK